MRQGGARHLEAAFYFIHALPLRTGADEQPKNFETVFLAQGRKLFDPSVHHDISSIIELYEEQES
jgi:hypothetical protein